MEAVRGHFRPEFINRLDDVVVFRSLALEAMLPIVQIQLDNLNTLLGEQGMDMVVSESACRHLANEGFDPEYGARPLRRTIQTALQDPIADLVIEQKLRPGGSVSVDVSEGGLTITPNNSDEHDEKDPLDDSEAGLSLVNG